ncbi:tetratricopeptide repeat protein [Apibacter sp. HY039]|uniref:tetratricopeptide repeat protein n=1 Tax=Apibacter sp. HY039 TaxID=2501476 RepID=UPI000FEBBCE8|nr:tetratricopeptide repeat protein [Apibacter sp. HY039]
MKKITISLLTLMALFSFGQDKEIKDAFNAFEGGNKSQAQTLIQQADPLVNTKISSIEPELYAKYLYVKGATYLDQGKTLEAAKVLAELSKYEKGPIYSLKNKNTKEKAFVLSKEQADKLVSEGFSGLKETKSGTDYLNKLLPVLEQKRQASVTKATDEYNSKDFEKSAEDFLESHYLTKAAGVDDDVYKYYAAVSYHAANNSAKALELYKELINEGYTGVRNTYSALNNKKERVTLSENDYNLLKKAPSADYTDLKIESTPSVEADLYNYAVSLLTADKKYSEALSLAEKGLTKFPTDTNLSSQVGELYYQTGNTQKYVDRLKESVQKNPNDYVSLYNLGVIYSKDEKTYDLAKEYYNKAVSVKPDYTAAYFNLAALALEPDKEIVNKLNNLTTSKEDQQKYDALTVERKKMFFKALPFLEKAHELEPKDKAVYQALENAYKVLQKRDKLDQLRKENN